MEYRGYIIDKTWKGYCYFKSGEKVFLASSIQDAKRQIDDYIFEHTIYEVEFCGLTHFFQWLSEAVSFTQRTGGFLRNQFDSI